MRILLTEDNHHKLDFVKSQLIRFVQETRNLYKKDFMTYNIHSLIHLTEDCQKYGNLENNSCFPFESY